MAKYPEHIQDKLEKMGLEAPVEDEEKVIIRYDLAFDFGHIGPFKNIDEARDYGHKHFQPRKILWMIYSLYQPKPMDKEVSDES
jgi:hypothetical protein